MNTREFGINIVAKTLHDAALSKGRYVEVLFSYEFFDLVSLSHLTFTQWTIAE